MQVKRLEKDKIVLEDNSTINVEDCLLQANIDNIKWCIKGHTIITRDGKSFDVPTNLVNDVLCAIFKVNEYKNRVSFNPNNEFLEKEKKAKCKKSKVKI